MDIQQKAREVAWNAGTEWEEAVGTPYPPQQSQLDFIADAVAVAVEPVVRAQVIAAVKATIEQMPDATHATAKIWLLARLDALAPVPTMLLGKVCGGSGTVAGPYMGQEGPEGEACTNWVRGEVPAPPGATDPETGQRLVLNEYGRACYRAGEASASPPGAVLVSRDALLALAHMDDRQINTTVAAMLKEQPTDFDQCVLVSREDAEEALRQAFLEGFECVSWAEHEAEWGPQWVEARRLLGLPVEGQ